jgi:hypothetical protein
MGKIKMVSAKNITRQAAEQLGKVAKKNMFFTENRQVTKTTKRY